MIRTRWIPTLIDLFKSSNDSEARSSIVPCTIHQPSAFIWDWINLKIRTQNTERIIRIIQTFKLFLRLFLFAIPELDRKLTSNCYTLETQLRVLFSLTGSNEYWVYRRDSSEVLTTGKLETLRLHSFWILQCQNCTPCLNVSSPLAEPALRIYVIWCVCVLLTPDSFVPIYKGWFLLLLTSHQSTRTDWQSCKSSRTSMVNIHISSDTHAYRNYKHVPSTSYSGSGLLHCICARSWLDRATRWDVYHQSHPRQNYIGTILIVPFATLKIKQEIRFWFGDPKRLPELSSSHRWLDQKYLSGQGDPRCFRLSEERRSSADRHRFCLLISLSLGSYRRHSPLHKKQVLGRGCLSILVYKRLSWWPAW